MAKMELFRRKKTETTIEYDSFEAIMGWKLDVEAMLYMREFEDYLIGLKVMTEDDRERVPNYLVEEWVRAVGPDEVNRIRATEE